MSKKNRIQNHQGSDMERRSDETAAGSIRFESDKPKARVTEFVPRPCTACQAFRDIDPEIQGRSCSRVYSTQARTRYCKCGYCGICWKEVADK